MGTDDNERFRPLGTITVENDDAPTVYASSWTDGDSVVELIYLLSRRILSARIEAAPARYRTDDATALAELGLMWGKEATKRVAELASELSELSDVSVSPAFVRDLRMGELLNTALDEHVGDELLAVADSVPQDFVPPPVSPYLEALMPGGFTTNRRRMTAHLRMLRASVVYVEITERGMSKPMTVLAESLGCTESTARALITRARIEGYLTPGERGKPGGQLTDRAKMLLKAVRGSDSS